MARKKNVVEDETTVTLVNAVALPDTIEACHEMINEKIAELASAEALNDELQARLDASEKEPKVKAGFGTVTVDGVKYEIVRAQVVFEDKAITAADIKGDAELAKRLVAEGASCLKEK